MKVLVLALAVALSFTVPAVSFGQMETVAHAPALVTVTGEYKESFAPDQLSFSVSVNTEGEDLVAAKQQNAGDVNAILDYLVKAGVPAKDIQTRYLNVNVRYQDQQRLVPRYVADQQIQVMLREIDKYDDISTALLQRA